MYDPYTAFQSINYSYNDSNSEGKSFSDIGSGEESSNDLFKKYCQYYGYDDTDQAVRTYFEGKCSLYHILTVFNCFFSVCL